MISAVILTKNEEKNIVDCIKSLLWCDEVIIIDDYSSDNTIINTQSLQSNKLKIYQHHMQNDFAKQRNFGLQKALYEWVVFIDADERVSSSLQYEILSTINASLENFSGYYIKRRDILWSKELHYGESGNIKLLRLGRKKRGEWVGNVHETWSVTGKTGELSNYLMHYPHQTITEFLSEINYYTDLRAQSLYEKKVKVSAVSIVGYTLGKFIQNFVYKKGFLDGIPGLLSALFMSLHSFLVRGKLWYLWQQSGK
jgi:glycosyltransferase involved in cell wall biosynthesis